MLRTAAESSGLLRQTHTILMDTPLGRPRSSISNQSVVRRVPGSRCAGAICTYIFVVGRPKGPFVSVGKRETEFGILIIPLSVGN